LRAGHERKDSAAQLQGLKSGARGGRNQSSTPQQQSEFAVEGRSLQNAEQQRQLQTAQRSTAGRRAGSGEGGVARVAPRGRPARGTAAGQAGAQGANSQQQPR